MTTPSQPPPPSEETASPRVALVMQELRSGVRQRLGELATLPAGGDAARAKLAELKAREFVREPAAFSHRPGLGRLIVFARKAVYHAFLKWFTRPVIEQQNSFNQASTALAQDLLTAQDDLRREVQQLHARVAQLERRLPSDEAPAASVPPRS
ncbi:MAG: hypothetical protein ABI609_17480 [Acidobacteriota bacterium]